MPKIVVAIDSLKGCLTSQEAGEAAAEGVKRACPWCEVSVLPVADGGEGMLEALAGAGGGRLVRLTAHGPLMEERETCYGVSADGATAVVEMARISGLPLVPAGRRNPMQTTTLGTGEVLRDALRRGCRRVLLGLGGSATNDAGLGMLQALGYRFLDAAGREVGQGGQALARVERIDASDAMPELAQTRFVAACDVQNPFYGPQGAACVFAPQKGATPAMVKELDDGLRHFADIVRRNLGTDIATLPGAGAAGGLGGGVSAFLHAELRRGIELVLECVGFARRIRGADLVLTGEGKSDRQTLMGKVPAGVLAEASRQGIPVALLAGRVEDEPSLREAGFRHVLCINPPRTPDAVALSPDYARRRLVQTTEDLVRTLFP